jgi:hypothetical protein
LEHQTLTQNQSLHFLQHLKDQREMSKYISAAFFRDVANRQRYGGEDEGISFDYMLELIEQEVIKNYEKGKAENLIE